MLWTVGWPPKKKHSQKNQIFSFILVTIWPCSSFQKSCWAYEKISVKAFCHKLNIMTANGSVFVHQKMIEFKIFLSKNCVLSSLDNLQSPLSATKTVDFEVCGLSGGTGTLFLSFLWKNSKQHLIRLHFIRFSKDWDHETSRVDEKWFGDFYWPETTCGGFVVALRSWKLTHDQCISNPFILILIIRHFFPQLVGS